ncbi:hypothetical protein ACTMTI_21905 [Nonomuraea sp. H19]|uniref:hypothetical protein n=1 Tax=Nonomuraea sp. H19 TaxID=3452206 RepID=UPI003F8CB03D
MPEQAFARAWRLREQLEFVVAGAAGFVVLAIVLAVAGPAGHSPAFFISLFFAVMAFLNGLAKLRKQRRRLRNVITREGREVLSSARGYHPRGLRDPGSLAMAVGVPVALYGLADAGDQTLCDELSAGDPSADCAGSCGTHSGGGDSYGGLDFGGGSSSCGGGSSSSCGSGGSSCGGGSSSSCGGGGSSCGGSS